MNKQVIIIEGNNFSDIESFYDEIDSVLTKNLVWKTGHNLNAFNDLLYGGFGVFEFEDEIILIWKNFAKSKTGLKDNLASILEIIESHKHIEFRRED